MNLYHLRLEHAGPEPGGDPVSDRLGAVGVVIVDRAARVDRAGARYEPVRQAPSGDGPVAEITIDLQAQIDLPLIEHVLRPAGYRVLDLRPAPC